MPLVSWFVSAIAKESILLVKKFQPISVLPFKQRPGTSAQRKEFLSLLFLYSQDSKTNQEANKLLTLKETFCSESIFSDLRFMVLF